MYKICDIEGMYQEVILIVAAIMYQRDESQVQAAKTYQPRSSTADSIPLPLSHLSV